MYLVRNLFPFKTYCTLCAHVYICTLTGHVPSTWCTHDVPAHFSSYCVKWPCNSKAAMQFALTTFHLHGCRTLSVCAVRPNMYAHMYALTAVAMHEVPYGSYTDCGLVQMYVWCSACRTHEQTVLTQLYIHNHHNSDNSQIGILNSIE